MKTFCESTLILRLTNHVLMVFMARFMYNASSLTQSIITDRNKQRGIK